MSRPFSATSWVITGGNISWTGQVANNGSDLTALIKLPDNPTTDGGPFGAFNSAYFNQKCCHLWKYTVFGYQGYVRMVCEPLVVLIALFQLVGEILDISNIGRRRWWQILTSFPTKMFYKLALVLILCVVPIRFLCGLSDTMLLLDNMLSIAAVVMMTVHFLYYCRAVNFVGPFVLMIYKIITQDLFRFFLIYFIFLIGFSQGFFIVFRSCERSDDATAMLLPQQQLQQQNGTTTATTAAVIDQQQSQDTNNNNNDNSDDDQWQNIMASPFEALIRLFIMTTGEFQVFYGRLGTCPVPFMLNIGKVLFFIYEIFVSLMQFNLLIAMMTRTYEMIYATEKEWKRQWAQVILMIELSINPKARLMAMLGYSRPIGTDKRKRAFVVSKKKELDSESERLRKEQQANAVREEKKMILKRKLKDAMNREGRKSGMRPTTSYLIAKADQ